MNILLVEDDKALNNGIAMSLKEYKIIQAYTVCEAKLELEKVDSIDLIILDINLPDGSGLDLCKKIRQTSNTPVIFLTANDMETDVVSGFETGADDYITKPFSLAVLRARVNAVLRRKQGENNIYKDEKYIFDFDKMKFMCDGNSIELSKTEQKLLKIFISNKGVTLPRNMLLDKVWDSTGEFVDENALSVTIKRLRGKIADIPIKTVYGIGYVWEKK